jgi:hypothetical protein
MAKVDSAVTEMEAGFGALQACLMAAGDRTWRGHDYLQAGALSAVHDEVVMMAEEATTAAEGPLYNLERVSDFVSEDEEQQEAAIEGPGGVVSLVVDAGANFGGSKSTEEPASNLTTPTRDRIASVGSVSKVSREQSQRNLELMSGRHITPLDPGQPSDSIEARQAKEIQAL